MIYVFNADDLGFGDAIAIYISIWLLGIGNLSMCMVLQNLFSDSKMASFLAFFIIFGPVSVSLIAVVQGPCNWVQYLYFIPNFSFEVVIANILLGGDLTEELFFPQSAVMAWIFQIIAPVAYYFFYIYIEAIMP